MLIQPSGHRQQTTIGRRQIVNGSTLQQTITANTQPMRRIADAVQRSNRLKSLLRLLGPGLITGAANDDPCAIGTYAKAGAAFGFSTLWIAPVVFPMMATSMFLCGKNDRRVIKSRQGVKITRIAMGIPVGSDIEYTDEITMLKAMEGRREL